MAAVVMRLEAVSDAPLDIVLSLLLPLMKLLCCYPRNTMMQT
ncbi:hypothetical protein Lalb_Chr12g0207791 [Lupinus albus]|uniref:Uncharacterized protein n=1 Tax=Lupinus albus TaxID=3870 RepID=A0A6A4PNW2_LUPAL|nr:hypothetical protein Lalb_Chr12g0207791 [Lupinus albus]